jgi:hypothetical protein
MIGTIRRHQVWLWVIIVAVMSVSLVYYFNPAVRSSSGGRSVDVDLGSIGGQRISQEEFDRAAREVALGYVLNGRRPDLNTPQLRLEIYQNLFLNKKQEELGIKITDEAAANLARRMGVTSLDDFAQKKLKPENLDKADFVDFCRHQLGVQQLLVVTGTSGSLVTPREAEIIYRAQNSAASALMVYFPLTNYLDKVTNTPSDLEAFYSNNLEHFRVPEKVAVNYVKFDATNYLTAARAVFTNLDQSVEEEYKREGTNLPAGTKTPEEARAKIKEMYLEIQSSMEAKRAGNAFAQALDKAGPRPETFLDVAKQKGMTVKTTAPFDAEAGPEDTNLPPTFVQAAFQLSPDAPFTGVVPAEDGVYVLGFKQRIQAVTPSFKDIESKVVADFREAKARELALDDAGKFDAIVADQLNVNNGVTLPKDFNTIADENDRKVQALPPISLSTTNLSPQLEDRVGLNLLKRVVFSTEVGTPSKAWPAPQGAFVLYVDKLSPPDAGKIKAELPELLTALRRQRENEAFELWMNAEINRDPELAKKMEGMVKEIQGGSAASQAR